jgi:hypothetical protein
MGARESLIYCGVIWLIVIFSLFPRWTKISSGSRRQSSALRGGRSLNYGGRQVYFPIDDTGRL